MDIRTRFTEIYEQTWRLAGSLAAAGCRQSADIGDLVQEVYLELYRILQKRGPDYITEPEAMIRKLMRQKLARYWRTLSRRREVQPEPLPDGTEIEMADITALSIEEIAVDGEILQWTDRHLKERGEPVRRIFHLYYRFGVSLPEIARLLDLSESDVKNKLYRTLKQIRDYWKENNE